MPPTPEGNDPQAWHRYFAIEANNRAWGLAAGPRTPEQDRELLDAAHAAAFHWDVAGEDLHRARATLLLAEAHALLGLGPSALAYATEVRDFFAGREAPDWEVAFVHTVLAHAAAADGDAALHASAYAAARAGLDAVADPEDKAIVLEPFEQVPKP